MGWSSKQDKLQLAMIPWWCVSCFGRVVFVLTKFDMEPDVWHEQVIWESKHTFHKIRAHIDSQHFIRWKLGHFLMRSSFKEFTELEWYTFIAWSTNRVILPNCCSLSWKNSFNPAKCELLWDMEVTMHMYTVYICISVYIYIYLCPIYAYVSK